MTKIRIDRESCLHETTCLIQSGESLRVELTIGETGHISIRSAVLRISGCPVEPE